MNNSEAIKRDIEVLLKQARECGKLNHNEFHFISLVGLANNLIIKARSEAFEEAIQALPEKKIITQEMEQELGEDYPAYEHGFNDSLSEIKEILMKLKGKNG